MSTGWAAGPMTAFDFESDGVDVLTARVIQAATVDLRPRDPGAASRPAFEVDRWASLVDPGPDFTTMNPEAEAVHGISLEQVKANGVPSREAIGYVATQLDAVWAAGGVVVGHNIGGYDLNLLAAEMRRHGLPPFEVRGPVIDTLTLERCDLMGRVDRYRKNKDIAPDGQPVNSRKLVDTVRWWQVRMDPELAHDASEDALASVRVAWRIAQRYPEIAGLPLDEINPYMAAQHRKWADDFEPYLIKTKTAAGATQEEIDAIDVPREWPLRAEFLPAARDEAA